MRALQSHNAIGRSRSDRYSVHSIAHAENPTPLLPHRSSRKLIGLRLVVWRPASVSTGSRPKSVPCSLELSFLASFTPRLPRTAASCGRRRTGPPLSGAAAALSFLYWSPSSRQPAAARALTASRSAGERFRSRPRLRPIAKAAMAERPPEPRRRDRPSSPARNLQ
jgi:hypothetical protein